ncbi:unnamed protein product [Prunus brigantina]
MPSNMAGKSNPLMPLIDVANVRHFYWENDIFGIYDHLDLLILPSIYECHHQGRKLILKTGSDPALLSQSGPPPDVPCQRQMMMHRTEQSDALAQALSQLKAVWMEEREY